MRSRVLIAPLSALVVFAAVFALSSAVYADTSFNALLGQFEQMYQLPSGILAKVAIVENGGKATGCAPTSSACGMFQWTTDSWLAATKALFGQPYDLSGRNDPSISAKVTAFSLADTKAKLGSLIQRSGIDMTVGLYLGHFLGTQGAQVFLNAYIQNPGQNACALFPKGCAANGSVLQRSLSGVVNYFAQKLSVPGVLNVAGNFQDTNGISYAYSYADVNSASFLPASTVISPDHTYDYPPVYTTVGNAPPLQNPSTQLLQPPPPPPQITPATNPTQPVTSTATTSSASSSSMCSAQYYCSNNTVYFRDNSCSTSVFEQCQFGCLGTICAPSPSAASSSLTLPLQNQSSLLSPGQIATPVLSTSSNAVALSPLLNSNISTIVPGQNPLQTSTTGTSYIPQGTGYDTTVTLGNTGSTFATPGSPLYSILDQLKSALNGLLSYLGSL